MGEPSEDIGVLSVESMTGRLALQGVTFTYPARQNAQILKGFDLEIPASKVVALVGPSGNGKSTVISLVNRLYNADEGVVTIDGVNIWDIPHTVFHRLVSIVGQEPVLYARTIRENILFGLENPKDPKADVTSRPDSIRDDEIHAVSKDANAHDFIMRMPKGYETEVGERGVQLSGGQKQRIAIARALIRKPKVLLLDEATSALDAASEKQVQQAIDAMISTSSMTVVIIAHRLSTVKNAHMICVIQGGQVVEQGGHEELIQARGHYFELVETQMSGKSSSA